MIVALRVAVAVVLLTVTSSAHATYFTVTKWADTADGVCDADCSLREAVIAANANPGDDNINLPAGTYLLSLEGGGPEGGDLDITDSLSIYGVGAALTTVHGQYMDRVFDIQSGTRSVTLSLMSIRGGRRTSGGGGAIEVEAGAGLTLYSCTVEGSRTEGVGDDGGGIFNAGTLMVLYSTIRGNTTSLQGSDAGGGIQNVGTLFMRDSTVRDNSASDGAGIWSAGRMEIQRSTISDNISTSGFAIVSQTSEQPVLLANSTVSGNFSNGLLDIGVIELLNVTFSGNSGAAIAGGGGGVSMAVANTIVSGWCGFEGTVVSGGGNVESPGSSCGLGQPSDLVDVPPEALALGPLADHGGSTLTHALGGGSTAVGAAVPAVCPLFDQRGTLRGGAACDAGAYQASSRCEPDDHTLCIDDVFGDARFKVTASFASVQGGGIEGSAPGVALSEVGVRRGGVLSFIDKTNPEILVKVLNGCAITHHFWVFYAATTTVGFELTVEDTLTGTTKSYANPDQMKAEPVTDTSAFATCSPSGPAYSFGKVELFPSPPATLSKGMPIYFDAAYTAPAPVVLVGVPDPIGPASFFSIPFLFPAGGGAFTGSIGSHLPQQLQGVKLQMLDPDEYDQGNFVVLLEKAVPAGYSLE